MRVHLNPQGQYQALFFEPTQVVSLFPCHFSSPYRPFGHLFSPMQNHHDVSIVIVVIVVKLANLG
jgi:hypothetical protein